VTRTARDFLLISVIICLILSSLFIYFPTVSGESDEWLAIENEFFVIKYHPGQGEEAEEALAGAMWVRENTLEKYPHTLNLKVTITIYSDRDELTEKEGAYTGTSHVGVSGASSSASIGILSPSWTGHWGGYEGLDHPFRRVLNHEYVHVPFYIDLYMKNRGYKDPQPWFSQGLAEYISDNYLPCYVNRVRESVEQGSFTINEPYAWGLYIVEYMYSKYGMDKVIDIIKSDEPTFNGALEAELGTNPLEFEEGWRRYVADKFGVEYPSSELDNNTVIEAVQTEDDVLLEERLKEIEISLNELREKGLNITVNVNGLDEVYRIEDEILENILEIQQKLEDIEDKMVTILGVSAIICALMVASIIIFVYYARKGEGEKVT